jgi:hypothetical protein
MGVSSDPIIFYSPSYQRLLMGSPGQVRGRLSILGVPFRLALVTVLGAFVEYVLLGWWQ